MNKPSAKAALIASMLLGEFSHGPSFIREPKPLPKHKCWLPGCENLTAKRYCCADHCKAHQPK